MSERLSDDLPDRVGSAAEAMEVHPDPKDIIQRDYEKALEKMKDDK